MARVVDEQTEIEELIEEARQREKEQWERMDPRFREYLMREYFPQRMSTIRKYPSGAVAGIPPELARLLDLTEEEILKYSA